MAAADNFRTNLKRVMSDRGLSLRGMEDLTGKKHSYFQKILNGSIIPGLDNCEQIADALKIPLTELIGNPKKLAKTA